MRSRRLDAAISLSEAGLLRALQRFVHALAIVLLVVLISTLALGMGRSTPRTVVAVLLLTLSLVLERLATL